MANPSGFAHLLPTSSRSSRRLVEAIALGVTAAALVSAGATSAAAVPTNTDTGTTTANVVVDGAISLTGLTNSFALEGTPGTTVELANAVHMNVQTNNSNGYAVGVQAERDVLLPGDTSANGDYIPIAALKVREAGASGYTSVSDATPVTVHTQSAKSGALGDALANDYSITIPFVNSDTYSVTLDYVAAAL